jgi:hypothetical protein
METKNFFVKNEFSNSDAETSGNRKWHKFICWMNGLGLTQFRGNCIDDYYGVSDDGTPNSRSWINAGEVVISLDEALLRINYDRFKSRKSFVVECTDTTNTDWRKFIDLLNNSYNVNYDGDMTGYSYGLINSEPKCVGTIGMSNHTPMVLPSDEGIALLEYIVNKRQIDMETMVTTYNGDEHPVADCVILDDHSSHDGEYALKSECLHSRVYGGYILASEAAQDARGSFFIEDNADDLDYVWSEYNDAWINTNWNDVHYGYTSRRYEEYFMNDDYAYINGSYYVDSDVAGECGYYYDDDADEWYHEDDDRPVNSDPYNITYHSNRGREFRAGDAKFTVGVEVEKEDDDACTLHWNDVFGDTGWIKEKDGSLGRNGYELVSPVFNLFNDGMDKEIEASNDLQTLINAGYSDACGGHINLGSTEYTPAQLFEGLSAFMPLLYAMYPNRVDKHFCQAKSKYKYRSVTSEYEAKYSAAYIKDKVVEFRIFPAVRSVKNLLWRRDLVRIMCDNINKSELDVLKMLVNQNSKLYKHLRKIYSQDLLLERTKNFIMYTERFNDKKLPPIDPKKLRRGEDNIIDSSEDLGA